MKMRNLWASNYKLLMTKIKYHFNKSDFKLIHWDCFVEIKKIKDWSIDLIFADPPYFLSSNWITCSGWKMVSVNKGSWDKSLTLQEKHEFNKARINECYRVLKNTWTIWISWTFHNIYSIGMALEENNFKIINNITRGKINPPPNLACKAFTHSTETILWAKKNLKKMKYTFNYALMKDQNGWKQMKDIWMTSLTKKSEKEEWKHPTQKPIELLERIILASSNEWDLILDPFSWSWTTGLAAVKHNRKYIGIENKLEYLNISVKRYKKQISI